jgi:hypothetical protein
MREIAGLPLTTDSHDSSDSSSSTDQFSGAATATATAASTDDITAELDDGVLLVNNPASVSQVWHMT